MSKKEITLLTYEDVLEKLKNQECHLLLGNGFNRGLGVNTSYEAIFQKMIENDNGIYKDAKDIAVEEKHNLEKFIGRLLADIDDANNFLRKYVANKVKFDFMKAAHEIVKSEIKNVYAEKNEGVFILLKNFTNYFTLNYDSFLYLFLLNFKLSDKSESGAIAVQPSLKFIEEDLNVAQNNIYSEIKRARDAGALEISVGDDSGSIHKSMDELPKTHFVAEIKQYSKTKRKNWKDKDIRRVVNAILEEERKNKILRVDDGSKQRVLFDGETEFVLDVNSKAQNLFFLHGAFHLYRDGKLEKRIAQSTDKALYDRLEEILNDGDKDIICVFQPENKMDAIKKSKHLMSAYNKLATLSGSMVVIGCSLADNDSHIFDQINKSSINTLYISVTKQSKNAINEKARKRFPEKNIILFEAESISYELPAAYAEASLDN